MKSRVIVPHHTPARPAPAPLAPVQPAAPQVTMPAIVAPMASSSAGKRRLESEARAARPAETVAATVTNGQSAKLPNGEQQAPRRDSTAKTQNLLSRLNLTSPAPSPQPTPPPSGERGASSNEPSSAVENVDRPLKRRKMADRLDSGSVPSLLARIDSTASSASRVDQSTHAEDRRMPQSSRAVSAIVGLPRRPEQQDFSGVRGMNEDVPSSQARPPAIRTNSTSQSSPSSSQTAPRSRAATDASGPPPALVIAGAASKNSGSAKSAGLAPLRTTIPAPATLSIKGAASGGALPSPGAVSFQKAMASIGRPNSSLDSLKPTPRQLQDIAAAPPLPTLATTLPPQQPKPTQPPSNNQTNSTSLLSRLTSGGGERPTPPSQSRSLSERMQLNTAMDVDEPASSSQKRKKGRR